MKNEILVTGATGFLGRHLVTALESQGRVVRQHSSADGDIASCSLPMEGVSHVFHLAARSYVPESWQNPRSFYHTNVMGTVNVLEHCRQNHAALTLLSSYVYGQPQRLPIAEDHPLVAANPYAHTKILAEDTARFYEQRFGISLLIVRPFNIYGPGQRGSFLIPFDCASGARPIRRSRTRPGPAPQARLSLYRRRYRVSRRLAASRSAWHFQLGKWPFGECGGRGAASPECSWGLQTCSERRRDPSRRDHGCGRRYFSRSRRTWLAAAYVVGGGDCRRRGGGAVGPWLTVPSYFI